MGVGPRAGGRRHVGDQGVGVPVGRRPPVGLPVRRPHVDLPAGGVLAGDPFRGGEGFFEGDAGEPQPARVLGVGRAPDEDDRQAGGRRVGRPQHRGVEGVQHHVGAAGRGCAGRPGRVPRAVLLLDLHEQSRPGAGQLAEQPVEGRDGLRGAGAGGDVQGGDPVGRQVGHPAVAVGDPVDGVVVHQHRHAVAGGPHVGLQPVRPAREGGPEGGHGVLRGGLGGTAVAGHGERGAARHGTGGHRFGQHSEARGRRPGGVVRGRGAGRPQAAAVHAAAGREERGDHQCGGGHRRGPCRPPGGPHAGDDGPARPSGCRSHGWCAPLGPARPPVRVTAGTAG